MGEARQRPEETEEKLERRERVRSRAMAVSSRMWDGGVGGDALRNSASREVKEIKREMKNMLEMGCLGVEEWF